MKALEKQKAMETDNLWVARKILAEPERYKVGGLCWEWATMIVKKEESK